jgi:hypothetical protein
MGSQAQSLRDVRFISVAFFAINYSMFPADYKQIKVSRLAGIRYQHELGIQS